MSVTINGTVCRNCWDVDWAKKAEREQIEKHQAEARKAQEGATAPPDILNGADRTSAFDGQSATILDGALKGVPMSDGAVPVGDPGTIVSPTNSGPGRSIDILA